MVSAIFAGTNAEVVQRTGEVVPLTVQSLLTLDGIRWMFLSAVDNFIGFAPLGPVLTVMIGIGVAERTGFILNGTEGFGHPRSCILSDSDHRICRGHEFHGRGRRLRGAHSAGCIAVCQCQSPSLAGLAAAYAGVSGGFSANLLITGLDPMLSALTQQAAQGLDPQYTVNPACNYYFMVASTLFITVAGTFVTSKIVEPMLGKWDPSLGDGSQHEGGTTPSAEESRAFGISALVGLVMGIGILLLGLVPGAPLHDAVPEGEPAVNALHSF